MGDWQYGYENGLWGMDGMPYGINDEVREVRSQRESNRTKKNENPFEVKKNLDDVNTDYDIISNGNVEIKVDKIYRMKDNHKVLYWNCRNLIEKLQEHNISGDFMLKAHKYGKSKYNLIDWNDFIIESFHFTISVNFSYGKLVKFDIEENYPNPFRR